MSCYQLDHFVLTVSDLAATRQFYGEVLQVPIITFEGDRQALQIGHQKINLHVAAAPIAPCARYPTPGSADFCLITQTPLAAMITRLQTRGIEIEQGPVERTGAQGPLWSIYLRDPDGNLVEIANQQQPSTAID
ncbi:MAG: VOC family protein [Cyanobacteria bacterium P01_D01_bin.71]